MACLLWLEHSGPGHIFVQNRLSLSLCFAVSYPHSKLLLLSSTSYNPPENGFSFSLTFLPPTYIWCLQDGPLVVVDQATKQPPPQNKNNILLIVSRLQLNDMGFDNFFMATTNHNNHQSWKMLCGCFNRNFFRIWWWWGRSFPAFVFLFGHQQADIVKGCWGCLGFILLLRTGRTLVVYQIRIMNFGILCFFYCL